MWAYSGDSESRGGTLGLVLRPPPPRPARPRTDRHNHAGRTRGRGGDAHELGACCGWLWRSATRQASFASLHKLCTAHGQLLKGAWACVLDSLLTLFCANLLALPSYSTAAAYAGSRSGTSEYSSAPSASFSRSVPGQQAREARASKQLASARQPNGLGLIELNSSKAKLAWARAPNGGGKAGKGWFSPLALWRGSSEEKDDVDVEGVAAARARVGEMLPDIGLFFAEVMHQCQRRPTLASKETHTSVKRDPH